MGMEEVFKAFPKIETKRLILREIREDDYRELFEIYSDKEVMKYFGSDPMASIEEARERAVKFNQGFENKRVIRWAITQKGEDKVIGTCGFHSLYGKYFKAEIGYDLMKTYWGRGIMTEAAGAIIDFGFNNMDFNRIEALVEPENTASRRVVDKLGFKEEGLLRECAYYSGAFKDSWMLSLLKREYKTIKP